MIIDFHAHIWNTQLDQVGQFVAKLDELGIDQAVVLPIAPYMSNEDVARLVEQAPEHIIGFASVVPFAQTTGIPRRDPLEELDHAVTELGLRGLKLHPIIQGFAMNDPGLVPVVRRAGELGIPVLLHTGPANGRAGRIENARVDLLDDLAIMCPDTILVAGHADPLGNAPYLARKHPNVYLETSISWSRYCALIPGLAKSSVELAGPEKILFGADYHLGREQRVYDMLDVFAKSGIDDADKELIFSGNAQRILAAADARK